MNVKLIGHDGLQSLVFSLKLDYVTLTYKEKYIQFCKLCNIKLENINVILFLIVKLNN